MLLARSTVKADHSWREIWDEMTFKIDADRVFFGVLLVFLVMCCVGCKPDESHLIFEVEKPDM